MSYTKGPWRFLEEGETESIHNRCEPLTICDASNVDLANVFSADDSTVATTREQAIANARLIAAAPALVEALRDAVVAMSAATAHLPVNELPRIACNTAIAKAQAALASATDSKAGQS